MHDTDVFNKPIASQRDEAVSALGPGYSHHREHGTAVTLGEAFGGVVVGLNHLPLDAIRVVRARVGGGLPAESGAEEAAEKRKASVRAKVEHPFLYVKRHFGYAKVRYRGVAKNRQRIALLLGFSNLLIAGRHATG